MAAIQGQNQIQDFLRALFKRRWQVGVPALLVATFGACFAVIVPKTYKLWTRIEISETRLEPDSRQRNPQEMAAKREAANAKEHVQNYVRVREIVERNPGLWPEYVNADEAGKQEFLNGTILKNLWAVPIDKKSSSGSIFVDIQYSDAIPERAAKFLADIADDWLQDVFDEEDQQLRTQRETYREMADEAQKRFDQVHDRFTKQAKQLDLDPMRLLQESSRSREEPTDWSFRERDGAKSKLNDVLLDLNKAQKELELRRERHEAEPEEISEWQLLSRANLTETIVKERAKLEGLEQELAKIKPDHSRYRRLQEEIDTRRTAIEELENGSGEARVERSAPNPRKKELLLAVQEQEILVKRLDGERSYLDGKVQSLEEETRQRTGQYKELYALRNEVEIALEHLNDAKRDLLSKEASIQLYEESPPAWRVTQPPTRSSASVQPNPAFLIAFAVAAGLALGVGLAVLSEYARSSYRTVADLASVMNVPVLGAIETIVTRQERRRRQASRALAGLSTAVIVGGVSWITWMWDRAPERLPVEVQDAIEQLRSAFK